MSRAAQSKSRADKKGGQSAPTPAVTHEIVPGKYTDVDWNRMVEFDEGEDFIGDLVDELVSGTLEVIHNRYMERQLLPYTISQAKDALLTIIDWRFLTCDGGEVDPSLDPTWIEDEEPEAPIPDCWAQGSVPKSYTSPRPVSARINRQEVAIVVAEEPIPEEQVEQADGLGAEVLEKPWEVTDEQVLQEEPSSKQVKEEEKVSKPTDSKVPTPPAAKPGKKRFRPHKGPLRSAAVKAMTESLEDTERRLTTEERLHQQRMYPLPEEEQSFNPMPKSVGSILKCNPETSDGQRSSAQTSQFQSGRPPGSRDVYYDEQGNVVAMAKINPDKLPTHRIKTKFYVVDPAVEAAQARLDAMRTGRFQAKKVTKKAMPDKSQLERSSILDYRSMKSNVSALHRGKQLSSKATDPVTPLPPPMIESMELAPGVIVREGDRVKRGPRQVPRTADKLPSKEILRPVALEPDLTISVSELLGKQSPMVRIEPTPVPPIKQRISTL